MNSADASSPIGLIAGRGVYPAEWMECALAQGARVVMAAFEGETDPALASRAWKCDWMRVGQLGRMTRFLSGSGARTAVMAGQIRPSNLFDLKPDIKALLLLAKLRKRNAESIFSAIADELGKAGVKVLPATTYMEDRLAQPGWVAGPKPSRRTMDDVRYGFEIAKAVSALDIGQTVVVKNGTVLAVEAFEGTNDALRRGGSLAKDAVAVKVSKPNQDMRFDVPVIGPGTLTTAAECGITTVAVEARKTLLLERDKLSWIAFSQGITCLTAPED